MCPGLIYELRLMGEFVGKKNQMLLKILADRLYNNLYCLHGTFGIGKG